MFWGIFFAIEMSIFHTVGSDEDRVFSQTPRWFTVRPLMSVTPDLASDPCLT